MLTELPFNPDGQNRLISLARWNPYVSHWPVVLAALRELWEKGKISELKSPFYEPIEQPASQ